MSKPVAEFKVYPGRGNPMATERKRYFIVRVFTNRGQMRTEYARLVRSDDKDKSYGAGVIPIDVINFRNGKETKSPMLGYAVFARTQLGMETLCHEAVHMAVHYLLEREWNPEGVKDDKADGEEELAYTIGNCARQLNIELWHRRLYRK